MPWTGVFFAEMFDAPLISFSPAGPVGPFMVGSGNDINLSVQPLIMGRLPINRLIKCQMLNV